MDLKDSDVQACIFPGATGGKTANRSGNPGISMTTTRYTGGRSVDDHENALPIPEPVAIKHWSTLVHRSLIRWCALSFSPLFPRAFNHLFWIIKTISNWLWNTSEGCSVVYRTNPITASLCSKQKTPCHHLNSTGRYVLVVTIFQLWDYTALLLKLLPCPREARQLVLQIVVNSWVDDVEESSTIIWHRESVSGQTKVVILVIAAL